MTSVRPATVPDQPITHGLAAHEPVPDGQRHCQYCGRTAETFDLDGAWCSDEHRAFDRQSEMTVWRRWAS